jgi:hypothetical protein
MGLRKKQFFHLLFERDCRIYRSGLRVFDDGRECCPDGTTQGPPEGCWIPYYATDDDVPYTEASPHVPLGTGAYGKVDVVQATHNSGLLSHCKFAHKEYDHKDTFNPPDTSAPQANLEREIGIYDRLEKEQPTNHRVKIVDTYAVGMNSFS